MITSKFYNYLFVSFAMLFYSVSFSQTTSTVNSVDITIDKNTSDTDLQGIKSMLAEYDVEANFDTVKRNAKNEITKISIALKSDYSSASSSYNFSGNAINPITFGIKNNNLYIGDNAFDLSMTSMRSAMGHLNFFSGNDSIFDQGFSGFKNFYGNLKDPFFMGRDSTQIEAIKELLQNNLQITQEDIDAFTAMFDTKSQNNNQRYRFVDNPNTNKLIVINGEISNFEKLNTLAKANKIESVDMLKPKSAISIYGDKAKDGAIIVTTK